MGAGITVGAAGAAATGAAAGTALVAAGAVLGAGAWTAGVGFTAGTLSVPEDEWLASETGEQLEREFDGGLSIIIAGLAEFRSGRATTA